MAELTPQERLQPSLLDRLTDHEPHQTQESREQRVLSFHRLRQSVLRDLEWLLNANNLAGELIEQYQFAAHSVVNYGLPDLAGSTTYHLNPLALERLLRQVIIDFEPRILRHSLKVRATLDEKHMNHNTLIFEIEGLLWAQPMPEQLYLKTELDLETGQVHINELANTL